LLRLPVSLREHAFWRLLLDSDAAAAQVLALVIDHLELFTTLTRPLDPAGHGWTLHQLSGARMDNVPFTVTTS
jgi:hypothetical protein